jgi:phospholipase/lecithinase/hemolysin
MISQGTSAQELEASVITQFNDMLASSLENFISSNPGSVGKIVDTQAPFLAVINNPTAYGAANATCFDSDGVTCVWWNNYHPGQAIQKLVAEAVASAWSSFF